MSLFGRPARKGDGDEPAAAAHPAPAAEPAEHGLRNHPWLGLWPGRTLRLRHGTHRIQERLGYALVHRRYGEGEAVPAGDPTFAPGWVDLRLQRDDGASAWLTVRFDGVLDLVYTRLAEAIPFDQVPDGLCSVMAGHRDSWWYRSERFQLEEEGVLQPADGHARVQYWHLRAPSSERLHVERWGEAPQVQLYVGERLRPETSELLD